MALSDSEIKTKFQSRIYSGLQRVFTAPVSVADGYPPIADEMWQKLADAISDIAIDLVQEIHDNAEVRVGIHVTGITEPCIPGSPVGVTGATDVIGKID